MKKFRKNGIILAVVTFIVLFLVLKDDFPKIINLLKDANYLYIIIALVLQFLFIIFESLAFDQILKSYKSDFKFIKTFKLMLITKFFNGITPFSTGGQPMQVYLLKKDGFRLTKATNAIMQNFILYQLALVTIGIVTIITNHFLNIFRDVELLRILVTVGFLINTLVMVILFIISFSNKFNKFIIELAINVLYKLKIVKNKELQKEKWQERCNDFHEGATYIKEHKLLCLKGYIYYIISMLFLYLTPLFAIKALGQVDMNILQTIVGSSYVMIIGSFVPIPGGSGGIEFGFMKFFGNFANGPLLSAGLLIWRTATYYIPMIIGAIVFNMRKED